MPVLSYAEGPEAGPLDILAQQLLGRAPPSVTGLLHALVPEEGFAEFMELVQEYLPYHQAEILSAQSPAHQIALFANHFRDYYFPLPYFEDAAWNDFSYSDLLAGIPLIFIGMNWDDWHELPYYDGIGRRLMASLVASPWGTSFGSRDDGARVPLVESCRRQVSEEQLERIPQEGFEPAELHRWLDDTQYWGLALLADVVWSETGVPFMDLDEESMPMVGWHPDNVQALTQEWLRAQQLEREICELEELLDEEPESRFRELLDFIDRRRETPSLSRRDTPPSASPGPYTPLIDVFDQGERR
jgi:hypothetical protein